jgi:hypothetical protein
MKVGKREAFRASHRRGSLFGGQAGVHSMRFS